MIFKRGETNLDFDICIRATLILRFNMTTFVICDFDRIMTDSGLWYRAHAINDEVGLCAHIIDIVLCLIHDANAITLLMPPSHLTLAKPKSGFLKFNLHTIDII